MNFGRAATWRSAVALTAATSAAAALVAACGGGGRDGIDPEPVIASPTGPLALNLDASAGFAAPDPGATEYQKHLAVATANAGKVPLADPAAPGTAAAYDPDALRVQWCYTAEHTGSPPELQDRALVAPTKMFDNIWSFGTRSVLQYAFKADNGKAFLIDTLNNTNEAKTITEPGLLAMGLSPSLLEGAMPTHGHGDHTGGAGYLQQTYGIPIYLGSADAAVGARGNPPFTVTSIDSDNLNPQDKDFGGLKMTLLSTPGHTVGTFSGVVPAKLGDKEYRLAFWGGTAMPGTLALAKQYLDGSERLYRLSAAKKIDGTMHTHPFVDGSLAKLDTLGKSPSSYSTANPFLIGNALAMRSLSILRECSAAKVAQLDATAKIDAWHTTVTQASVAMLPNSTLRTTAVLKNPFGVLQNATVTFTVLPSGATCTAATDAKGQAGCIIPQSGQSQPTSVTAEFAEAKLADGSVELASSGTAQIK